MAFYKIGTGYYGIDLTSVKVSEADRQLADQIFREVFAIPSGDQRLAFTPTQPVRPKAAPAVPRPVLFVGKPEKLG
jgi:hypothetical protein